MILKKCLCVSGPGHGANLSKKQTEQLMQTVSPVLSIRVSLAVCPESPIYTMFYCGEVERGEGGGGGREHK